MFSRRSLLFFISISSLSVLNACSRINQPSEGKIQSIKRKVMSTRTNSTFGPLVKNAELEGGGFILSAIDKNLEERTLYQAIVQASDWAEYKKDPVQYAEIFKTKFRESGLRVVKSWPDYGLFIFEGSLVRGQFDPKIEQLDLPLSTLVEFQHSEKISLKTKSLATGIAGDSENLNSDWNYFAGTGLTRFFENAKSEIGITPSGKSIKIGIVDTGISYAHPAFLDPQTGKNRIKKIFDTTLEGAAAFSETQKTAITLLDPKLKKYSLNSTTFEWITPFAFLGPTQQSRDLNIDIIASPELENLLQSRGSELRMGWLDEARFQSLEAFNDLNRNGKLDDRFLVLVFGTDAKTAITFIDFKGLNDFNNQKGLTDFNESGATRKLGFEKIGISLDDMSSGTNFGERMFSLSLVGMDPSAHGTHVTSIAAGGSFIRGTSIDQTPLRGLASRAEIYIARSIKSNGSVWGSFDGIIKLANEGVDWINLSFAGLSTFKDNTSAGVLPELLSRLTREKNIRFVVAAGNEGPGLQSLSSMAEGPEVISVAGLFHPRLLKNFNEPSISKNLPDLWQALSFSSRGPSLDYSFHPVIGAPGMLLAAAPLASIGLQRSAFISLQGTSMAAPFATGLLALLDETLRSLRKDSISDKGTLISAMNEGAQVFRDGRSNWHEVGHGLFRVDKSFELLKSVVQLEKQADSKKNDSIVRKVFALEFPKETPLRALVKTSLYMKLSVGEKKCQDLWLSRSPRPGLIDDLRDQVSEEIATTLETLKIEVENYGYENSFIELNGIDGANPKFWKILGNGVDELDWEDGAFRPRPENRLQICVDAARKPQNLSGMHGFLLKFYRLDSESGQPYPLPIGEFPISVEFDTELDASQQKNEIQFEVPHPLGVQQSFNVSENTLYSEIRVRSQGAGAPCSTLEALLLAPANDRQRQSLLEENIDTLSNCGPRSQVQFQSTKPTPGRWALGLRSRRNAGDSTRVFAQHLYYRGVVQVLTPNNQLNAQLKKQSFRWTLKPQDSPLVDEAVGASWSITGWENTRILKSIGNSNKTPMPVDSPANSYVCFSPKSETTALKFQASRSTTSEISSFYLEILECPMGILNPDDPSCSALDSAPSISGHSSLSTNTTWGQNYCARVVSLNNVDVTLTAQSKIMSSSSSCEVTSNPSAVANERAALSIDCPVHLDNEKSGSEIGSTAIGRVEIFLKNGRRILFNEEQRIAR